jgi:hypothetical protein
VEEFQDYRELLDDSMVQLLMSVDDVDVDHLMRVQRKTATMRYHARSHAALGVSSRRTLTNLGPLPKLVDDQAMEFAFKCRLADDSCWRLLTYRRAARATTQAR